jgi:hypothetical protein
VGVRTFVGPMRILVAPTAEQQGRGKLDFCRTRPGEILAVGGLKCTPASPRSRCGCRRSFNGIETGRATTVGVVAEGDEGAFAAIVEACLRMYRGEWASLADMVSGQTADLLEMIRTYEPGTRLRVRITHARAWRRPGQWKESLALAPVPPRRRGSPGSGRG